jgi:hypothetical protein
LSQRYISCPPPKVTWYPLPPYTAYVVLAVYFILVYLVIEKMKAAGSDLYALEESNPTLV